MYDSNIDKAALPFFLTFLLLDFTAFVRQYFFCNLVGHFTFLKAAFTHSASSPTAHFLLMTVMPLFANIILKKNQQMKRKYASALLGIGRGWEAVVPVPLNRNSTTCLMLHLSIVIFALALGLRTFSPCCKWLNALHIHNKPSRKKISSTIF